MREDAWSPLEILIRALYTFEKKWKHQNYEELGFVRAFLILIHEQLDGKVS